MYVNNPLDKVTPGLFSGFYKDGSAIFPGSGRFSHGISPARISTSKSEFGPGAYGIFEQNHDKWEGRYFLAHPDLKWVNITAKEIISSRRDLVFISNNEDWAMYSVMRITVETKTDAYQNIDFYHVKDEPPNKADEELNEEYGDDKSQDYKDKNQDYEEDNQHYWKDKNAKIEVLSCGSG